MDLFDIPVETITGEVTTLRPFKGKWLLIVNVASRCGFTPQYAALEALYIRRRSELEVLGFPCNQFWNEEPGTNAEIRRFCTDRYAVSFPMFAKINVNGPAAHPLYRHLKRARKGFLAREAVLWNFTKFLVDPDGVVRRRFAFFTSPGRIERQVFGPPVG